MEHKNGKENIDPKLQWQGIDEPKNISTDSLEPNLPQVIDTNSETSATSFLLDRSIGPALIGTTSSLDSPALGPMREDGDAKGSTTPTGQLAGHQSIINRDEAEEYADGLARELVNVTHDIEEFLSNQSAAIAKETQRDEEKLTLGEKETTKVGEEVLSEEPPQYTKQVEEIQKVDSDLEEIDWEQEKEVDKEEEKFIYYQKVEEVKGEEEKVKGEEEEEGVKEEEEEGLKEEVKVEVKVKVDEKVKDEEVEGGEEEEVKGEEEVEGEEEEVKGEKEVVRKEDKVDLERDERADIDLSENQEDIEEDIINIIKLQSDDSPTQEPSATLTDVQQQEAQHSFQTAAATSLLVDCDKLEEEMEFTKNYSDDLLMGQSDSGNLQGETMPSTDLADFELPPYSGSSSGSEPPRQHSTTQGQSSLNSLAAQATSSHQANVESSSPNLSAVKDLLMSSYSRISHVLHWKRPIETGIIFGIGLTLIITLSFFSIISVFAYSALGVILASALVRLYKAVMKTLNRSSDLPFDPVWNRIQSLNVSLSPEKTHELVDSSLSDLNASLLYLKQVLLCEDKLATIRFGMFLYLLTYIGAWFNGMTLITMSYLALFSVPIFYQKNKTKIDEYLNLATGQLSSTISLITNKATSAFGGSSGAPASSTSSKKQS